MRSLFPIAADAARALHAPLGLAQSLEAAQSRHADVGPLKVAFAPEIFDSEAEARARFARAIEAGYAELAPVFDGLASHAKPLARGGNRRWPNGKPERALRWRLVVRFWPTSDEAPRAAAAADKIRKRHVETESGRLTSVKPQAPLDFGLFAGDYEAPARDDPSLILPDE